MADWMFCLDCGDDLTSIPKERRKRNPSAAWPASAPNERILLHRYKFFLGSQDIL